MKKIIQGGILINEGHRFQADLMIENDRITQIAREFPEAIQAEAEIIDAKDCFVIPGVIDDQVHFREPGLTHKGNIAEGSRAAASELLLLWTCPTLSRRQQHGNYWKKSKTSQRKLRWSIIPFTWELQPKTWMKLNG